tara:strand:- start:531 stop:1145 length:615 start_codon:yes stop_codon:yes gene_type:complete
MRTQSEIKKNNIRKANLLKEHNHRTNKGTMNTNFGLYEQCGVSPRDTEGVYMGAPVGTEPMNDMGMMGNDMGMGDVCPGCGQSQCNCGGNDMGMDMSMNMMGNDMEGMDDDDMVMDNQMMMMFMNEDKMDEKCGGGYGKDLEEGCGDEEEYMNEMDDELMENYKAVTAKPRRDSWGNEYNQILTENTQVNGVTSLIHRMKNVIR